MTWKYPTERQREEREACLSCSLPECIPDHPGCAAGGDTESRKRRTRVPLCSQCAYARRVLSDNPHCPVFYMCPIWGHWTTGWRAQCNYFRPVAATHRPRTLERRR